MNNFITSICGNSSPQQGIRLSDKYNKMLKEIERVEKKLANESFVAKAPKKVVDEEKAKGEKYKDMLKQIEERISQMTK